MTLELTVEGMSCGHCEETVAEALSDVDGVENVAVDREADAATVEGDADTDALVAAVEDAGYDASA
jgi:copper chaperone CopZ